MSLVREALAKAERESAARTAREHGLPATLAESASPFRARRRRRWPWAAGLAAAALAGAGATALLLDRPPAATARASAPARAAAPPGTAPRARALPAPEPAPSAIATPAPPAADAAAAERPAAAPPLAAPAPGRPTRFVRELPLGGGRTILLGGVAWSEHAPLAYLNGRLVGVGERVEGLRVTRIGRDQVALDDGGREVVISLR